MTPLEPVKRVTALYDYEATSEEEISVREDVQYEFYEEDGDWTLVGAIDKKEVGYAPTAYLEVRKREYISSMIHLDWHRGMHAVPCASLRC